MASDRFEFPKTFDSELEIGELPGNKAFFGREVHGGLIGGIGAFLKAVSPQTEIVGCWPRNSPVMHQCLQAGGIVEVEELPTLSESTAGGFAHIMRSCRWAMASFSTAA